MDHISANAAYVFACVGEHADISRAIILAAIHYRPLQDQLSPNSVRKFLSRIYWTRVWIVQELFKATYPVVLCEDLAVSMHQLSLRYGSRKFDFWHDQYGHYKQTIRLMAPISKACLVVTGNS